MLDQILAQYDLQVAAVEPVRAGNNTVYAITTSAGKRFALRVHRPGFRRPAHTRSEMHYLSGLSQQMSVPEPIRTRSANWIAVVDDDSGMRHASLLSWLPGQVRRPEGSGAGPQTLYRIGAALAQIHHFSTTFNPPPDFSLPLWDASGVVGPSSPFNPGPFKAIFSAAQQDLLAQVQDRFETILEALGRTPSPVPRHPLFTCLPVYLSTLYTPPPHGTIPSMSLALSSLLLVLASWLDYLIKITKEKVPVRPIGHIVTMVIGLMAAVLALVAPFFSSALPTIGVILITLTTFSLGGLFLYLLTLARLPDTPPAVQVGDTFIPFESVTHEGRVFSTASWSGKRIMFKLYRGHW